MRRRVLIVEDDEDIRASLELALADAGWDVATAVNGRDGLRAALTGRPPDVVVLDLMMPVMHGWELTQMLRAHPALGRVPLVVTSAGTDDRQVQADAVLHKPYSLDILLRLLDRLVGPRHLEPQPEMI
jgi:CheY-like chemotaxis protein